MPFGDILYYGKGEDISTADNHKIKITKITAIGLKILGLPHIGLRERARIIFNEIKRSKEKEALDAGCGIGLYSFELKKRGFNVTGIDIDKEKIDIANKISDKSNIKVEFFVKDLTKLDIKKEFDLIVCSDVIEHIKDDNKVLKNLSLILKKDGIIVVTVPKTNKESRKNYTRFGHVRPGYTIEEITRLLEENNLKEIKVKSFSSEISLFAFKINEKLYKYPFFLGLFFYPLYFLSFLNLGKKEEDNCILAIAKKL